MMPWGTDGINSAFTVVNGCFKDWYDKLTTVMPRVYHAYLKNSDKDIQYGKPVVTYNANAGSDTVVVPAAAAYATGDTVTVAAAVTRTGYTFKEWNTAADGTGTAYAAAAKFTASASVTLYAIWTQA